MESFDPWFPEGMLVQTEDFDHASTYLHDRQDTRIPALDRSHIDDSFDLLEAEDLAILPCSRYRWKTFRLGEDLIELCDHLIGTLELCIIRQCDSSGNPLWKRWS